MKLKRFAPLFLRVAFALAFSVVLVQVKLDFLESYLSDLRFRLRPNPSDSQKIEIVLIDQDTVAHFKRIPDYSDHLWVAEKILEQKPAALLYVTPLTKLEETEDEKVLSQAAPAGTSLEAQRLASLLEKFPNQVFQITDRLFLKGEPQKNEMPAPFEKVPFLSAPSTSDGALFAKDGVTRRAMVDYLSVPLGYARITQMIQGPQWDPSDLRGQFEVYESNQLLIDFRRPDTFATTKFEDFIRQSIDFSRFKNKIVLIGDDLGKSLKAYVRTPFSRDASAMTLVELQANTFETFLQNSAPLQLPKWFDLLLTSLISILTVHIVLLLRPLKGIGLLFVTALALMMLGWIFFWPFRILIPMAHPLVAIFLCYYFFIPYRLILENRRSWEYQQKNRLLSQVEELKTNFISMMSHDLKTPIARIMGMTDLIRKDPNPLSSHQIEAVDHIRASSDDLLRFMNSILNYARIESEGVKLHLQSRDINQILEEVVAKHEFLARLKHIQLILETEPLFPIQVDPELIRQVFSNLVENAIKYSPENSKVLITSEETAGKVRVQVADQGPGVSPEDLPHLFMKFFRSSQAKSSPIKGSGLGLYLARYFVELHQGQVTVESEVGRGSTFTVELPFSG